MGSFIRGTKHKFYLNRFVPEPSLRLLFFSNRFFPTHTEDRMIKLHTHFSTLLFFKIREYFLFLK